MIHEELSITMQFCVAQVHRCNRVENCTYSCFFAKLWCVCVIPASPLCLYLWSYNVCNLIFKLNSLIIIIFYFQCSKNQSISTDASSSMSVCPICRKEVPESGLKNHLHYHKKKEEGLHVCQYCNKTFTTLHSLQVQ